MLIIAQHHKITLFFFFFFFFRILTNRGDTQTNVQTMLLLFISDNTLMEISLRINLIGHNLKFGTSSWYFHSDF